MEEHKLLEADTICIYPTRLTEAKQIDKAIQLVEQLKVLGQDVRMIVCNSWSNGQEEIDYLNKLKSESFLTEQELLFTSTFESKWCKDSDIDIQLGLPKPVVQDLLRLSDLFILPSISECCSMVMLEAGANKNLMILNQDLWSLHEFGGQIMNNSTSRSAMYLEFGSRTRPIANYHPSPEEWYKNKALEIIEYQNSNQAINFFKTIRKRHNPEWVYRNQLLPCIS
jgi:glycosyltransferase involved in cell wall biosynthesis